MLKPGDRVRFVSPASTPTREGVRRGVELLTSWGLKVEVGEHVFDKVSYLAGSDDDRLADLNAAIRDPGVRAVFATRGGKGAYRIVDGVDFEAARRDPKLVVGFSEITILHLALWQRCGLVGLHGPMVNWFDEYTGADSADALRNAVMTAEQIVLKQDPNELTSAVTIAGRATGFLMGGSLVMIATAVGAQMPSLDGAILFIEANMGSGLGQVDRALTQLMAAGCLRGLRGVAIGQFVGFTETPGEWTIIDVLKDRLSRLGVPVLGGLPLGHGLHPMTVPLGTMAVLDTEAGTLTVEAGVS